MTEPVSVSVPEAARRLGISSRHAYDLAANGKLPGVYRLSEHGRVLVHLPTLLSGIEARAAS